MSKKTINLNITEVENRETRLGTITAWDGSATELWKESNYELRSQRKQGGCGKQKACRLCELNSPLNQQTMCANAIVECQKSISLELLILIFKCCKFI